MAAPLNPARHAYDVAILGGGLAGLSLAARLAHPRFGHLRILVVEARPRYVRDKTWSYWATTPHPFQLAVGHRWAKWAVAAPGQVAVRCSSGLQYESIPSDNFYALAVGAVRAASHIDFHLGVRAEAIEQDNGVVIRLPDGPVKAGVAFDTRPAPAMGRHGLTQLFVGQEIETEFAVFDPDVALLMDFSVTQAGATHFMYVLPTSTRRAMVEDTWFAPAGFCPPDHRAAIGSYLTGLGAGHYTIGFEEAGALPMDPVFQPRGGSRLLPLGTAGGATRPSTGYAFTAIQARCDAIALTLAGGHLPGGVVARPVLTRFMDRVLLDLLERRPALAPQVFAALFAGCPPRRLVRFLTDQAGILDFAAVAAAIPFWPTVGAAMQVAVGDRAWVRPAVPG